MIVLFPWLIFMHNKMLIIKITVYSNYDDTSIGLQFFLLIICITIFAHVMYIFIYIYVYIYFCFLTIRYCNNKY